MTTAAAVDLEDKIPSGRIRRHAPDTRSILPRRRRSGGIRRCHDLAQDDEVSLQRRYTIVRN